MLTETSKNLYDILNSTPLGSQLDDSVSKLHQKFVNNITWKLDPFSIGSIFYRSPYSMIHRKWIPIWIWNPFSMGVHILRHVGYMDPHRIWTPPGPKYHRAGPYWAGPLWLQFHSRRTSRALATDAVTVAHSVVYFTVFRPCQPMSYHGPGSTNATGPVKSAILAWACKRSKKYYSGIFTT